MPDLLYVILPSLVAIVFIAFLIRMTGIAHLVVLETDEPVEKTIAEHFEGVGIDRIMRSADGTGALVYLKSTPGLVLVRALGDRMAVRTLGASTIKALSGKGASLGIALKDFTWPDMELCFADEGTRQTEENTIRKAINGTVKEQAHA